MDDNTSGKVKISWNNCSFEVFIVVGYEIVQRHAKLVTFSMCVESHTTPHSTNCVSFDFEQRYNSYEELILFSMGDGKFTELTAASSHCNRQLWLFYGVNINNRSIRSNSFPTNNILQIC